jgi:hypothetical protein
MTMELRPQQADGSYETRTATKEDIPFLGQLMYNAYVGTIDYEGETLEEAVNEIAGLLDGKYGPFLSECSFVVTDKDCLASAVLVTWFKETEMPLIAFAMTDPRFTNRGMSTFLLKMSINALVDQGYKQAFLVFTNGNHAIEKIVRKIGFEAA